MKKFFHTKKGILTVLTLVGLLISVYVMSDKVDLGDEIEIKSVTRGEVKEIVSETGYVQPSRVVAMAFERSGRVSAVSVKEGDLVEEGTVLIALDPAERIIELASARARLRAEEVRLSELVRGADNVTLSVSGSLVNSAETALENAKDGLENTIAQQNLFVANAQRTLRTAGLEAYITSGSREDSTYSFVAPVISGIYNSDEEGVYKIELYDSGAASGSSFRLSGLEEGTGSVSTTNSTPLGTRGLYIKFPDNFSRRTSWEIPIPNTRSTNYLNYSNAYKAAVEARSVAIKASENVVKSAEAALNQTNQQYTQVSSSARDERVEAQKALVSQMYAAVQAAELAVEKMTLKAPFAGIVTSISVEEGEIVSPSVPVVSLISDDNFELVVNISESDIQEINLDDTADVLFDAYDEAVFKAQVIQIAPTAKIAEGVRVFEVLLKFNEKDARIRGGLSADIDILAEKKEAVLAVPTRAIVEREDGKFVRSWDGRILRYLPVKTGLRGSNGMTEITAGLEEGDKIITFAREETIQKLATE